MQKENDIKDFLSNYNLNKEFLYIENYVRNKKGIVEPFDFNGISFDYFCEGESSIKTFELKLPIATAEYYGKFRGDRIPDDFFDDLDRLNYTQHFEGICKSCQKKKLELIISVYSDKKFPKDKDTILKITANKNQHIDEFENKNIKVYFKKIGISPEPNIEVDKRIQKYFDRETNNWYYKGVKLYNENIGIGSFAYFRRIIEKELFSILKDISILPSTDPKLSKLITEYYNTNKISSLYKNSFSLLPKSLQLLGGNPLEILYNHTSKGLHNLTEQECLDEADSIHKILEYVIIKINEEKSELLEIRNIIKNLKK
jgi:hypothetical protein